MITSRKQSTLFYFAGNQVLVLMNILRNLVLIPVFLRFLEVEVFGFWIACTGALTIMGLADCGLNSLVVQQTAHLYGKGDYESLGRTIVSILVTVPVLATLALALMWALAPWVPIWLGAESRLLPDLTLAFRLASLDASLMLTVFALGGILLGLQKPVIPITGLILAQATGIGVILLALWKGYGVVAIPLGMLAGTLLVLSGNCVGLWVYLRKVLPRDILRFEQDNLRSLLQSSSLLLVARACRLIASGSMGTVIALVLTAPLVVVFEVTRKAPIVLLDILSRLPLSLLPGLSHLQGTGEKAKFQQILLLSLNAALFLGIAGMSGVMLLNREFVSLWLGPRFYGGGIITSLFCLYMVVALFSGIVFNANLAAGQIRLITLASSGEAALQLSLSVVLGYSNGLAGVALAGVIAAVAGLIIQSAGLVRLWSRDRSSPSLGAHAAPWFFSGAAPGLIGWFLTWQWPPEGWWQLGGFIVGYTLLGAILGLALNRQLRGLVASLLPLELSVAGFPWEGGRNGRKRVG